ncbi:MAG: hypothetical protein ABIK98_12015, partial [Pseudomonadota bacterium]
MHKASRISLTIITVLVIALSISGAIALWLYSALVNREDMVVAIMQLMVIIPICLGIILFSIRYTSNQKESNQLQQHLEQAMQKLTAELEAEKARTQAAQLQTDQ